MNCGGHKADQLSASEKASPPNSALPTVAEPHSVALLFVLGPAAARAQGDSLLQKIFFSLWLQGCGPAINLIRNQLLNCK